MKTLIFKMLKLSSNGIFTMNQRDKLFETICSDILNGADAILAKFVYDIVCQELYNEQEINEGTCTILNLETTVEKFQRIVKLLHRKAKAQGSFLQNFKKLSVVFKKNNRLLKECAKPFQNSSTFSDIATISSVVTGGALCLSYNQLLFPVTAPVAVAGGIVSAISGGVAMKNSIKKLNLQKKKLDEAKMHTMEELDAFSAMSGWFTYLGELKKSIEVLIDYNVLKVMFQNVMKFLSSLKYQTNIKIGEYKDQLKKTLKIFLKKIKEEHLLKIGNEYTPVALVFIFVACLMNDENRIILECVMTTECLNLDPMSPPSFNVPADPTFSQTVGKTPNTIVTQKPIAKVSVRDNLLDFGKETNLLNFFYAKNLLTEELSLESHEVDWLCITNKIKFAAGDFEKVFFVMEDIYIMLKQYESIANADETPLTTIIVESVPANATEEDIRMAIKPHLPEEAWDCIKLQRLSTSGNNWLVQVLPLHSQQLYQQVQLVIKDQICVLAR